MQLTKRTKMMVAVASLVLLVAVPTTMWAGFGHGGFHGRDHGPEHVLEKLDNHAQELELSAGQMAEYEAVRGEMEDFLYRAREHFGQVHKDIHDELEGPDADMREIGEMVKTAAGEMPLYVAEFVDLLLEFWEVLDEPQQDEVMSHIRWMH